MPLETLQTLQDLEITGTAESQQDETQYEAIGSHEQQPAQTSHHSAPPHPASQAHQFEQTHSSPFYPPLLNSFGFDSNSTIPIDPGLLDAPFDRPAAPGPGGSGVAGFHQPAWAAQQASTANMDNFMVSPTSFPQYTSSMPLVPGMSSFEPMVSTTWSMDGSFSSTSASRGATVSSSLSVHGTSTPASSQSPCSPRKASTGRIDSPAASKEGLHIHLGMQLEPGGTDQFNKRRQSSGLSATQKKSVDKRSHRNNLSLGTSSSQVPLAPAPAPAPTAKAATSDDNRKNNNKKRDNGGGSSSSSSNRNQTTKTTTTTTTATSNAPPDPLRAGPSSQQPTTLTPPPQPDPRARNRQAANRCRAKSKVAVAELEATERAMGAEHQALTQTARSLRDEVLQLKNQLLMHGNCQDDLIQQYLANSARMVGSGVLRPPAMPITTTTTRVTTGGGPPMPQVAAPGADSSSSSRAMLSASPPRVLPGVLPSSSAPNAGLTAGLGHRKGVARRQQRF